MTLFPCKLAYSALLGLDSTFPKLDKNVAKKISHATQQVQGQRLDARGYRHLHRLQKTHEVRVRAQTEKRGLIQLDP